MGQSDIRSSGDHEVLSLCSDSSQYSTRHDYLLARNTCILETLRDPPKVTVNKLSAETEVQAPFTLSCHLQAAESV